MTKTKTSPVSRQSMEWRKRIQGDLDRNITSEQTVHGMKKRIQGDLHRNITGEQTVHGMAKDDSG